MTSGKISKLNQDMRLKDAEDIDPGEIPENILFPNQLNEFFRERIRQLTSENGCLRRSLTETEDELTAANQKLSSKSLLHSSASHTASDAAACKIVELSKKLREQTAELEVYKTRVKTLEAKLRRIEEDDRPKERPLTPTPSELEEKQMTIKNLTEKLQNSNNKLYDTRNQLAAVKHELKQAHKVIACEVGEKYSLQDLTRENGTWRGRSQQILALQAKIQQLQEQTPQASESPSTVLLRQIEKDRRASYDETTKQLTQKTMQLEEVKTKLDAAKARSKVLEGEMAGVKTKMASLLDKSGRDDELISVLTNQIKVLEDRWREQNQMVNKYQNETMKAQQMLKIETTKCEQIHVAIKERDKTISSLEQKIEEHKKTIRDHDESFSSMAHYEDGTGDGYRKHKVSPLDSEWGKMLELLNVTNHRLEDARRELLDCETMLRREKMKNVKLETKLSRFENEKLKTGRSSYSQMSCRSSDTSSGYPDASMKIEYLEEECLALKERIQTLQMEKNEDLKKFTNLTLSKRHEAQKQKNNFKMSSGTRSSGENNGDDCRKSVRIPKTCMEPSFY